MESFETDLMGDKSANKFYHWFNRVIGTDIYKYGCSNKRYFVCLELTIHEVQLIRNFLII